MAELPAGAAARPVVWGVAALLQAGADALWARFGPVAVRGELSGFARAASGHWYFSLKDEHGAGALIRCAMFRRAASLVDFDPADGQKVELRGRLDLYAPRGDLQLVVESLARVGQGSLYEEFLRLRARLAALGLFDDARKRTLPPHPRALGVVTSLAAAALHDVLSALRRRSPQLSVVIYPCLVQGAEAPSSIVQALAAASERREVDALLLVRGGGSLEDLWAFNDERVVHAIAGHPLPVVCGVGHETDITLADLAADLRAPTPTAAAELAAPARDELVAQLQAQAARLQRAARRHLQHQAQGLDQRGARLGQPARVLLGQQQRLQATMHRLSQALHTSVQRRALELRARSQRLGPALGAPLQRAQARLQTAGARLAALDPQRVLRRGYAWIEDAGGRAVTSVAQVRVGQPLRTVWADGAADTEVTRVEPLPATRPPGAA